MLISCDLRTEDTIKIELEYYRETERERESEGIK